jgi:diguanylate cyclase (GGDEF)-like protein
MRRIAAVLRAARNPGTRAWHRDPVLAAPPLVLVGVGGWFLLDHARLGMQTLTCWLLVAVFQVGEAYLCLRVSAMKTPGSPIRRFWRVSACAAALWASGYAIQFVSSLPHPNAMASVSEGPAVTACVGLGTLAMVIAMLAMPVGLRSAHEWACFWLDIGTVLVAAAAFGWYFAVPGRQSDSGDLLHVLAGPVVLLVCAFAIAKLLISGTGPLTRNAAVLASAAAGTAGVTEGFGLAMISQGRAGLWFTLHLLVNVLLLASIRVQQRNYRAGPGRVRAGRRPYTLVPYFMIGGIYTLLVVSLAQEGLEVRSWIVVAAAVGCTGLIVVRQLASFTENTRLLGQLREALRDRDHLAEQLQFRAFHDHLTGLANRALFLEKLDAALGRARRSGGRVAVALVDLDNFKPVNDLLGHAAGDQVLVEVAERLHGCLREVDTVARLGGDEFAVLLEDPAADALTVLAERIVGSIAGPFAIATEQVTIGASIGLAVDEGGACTPSQLLHDADVAMYQAKRSGKAKRQAAGTNDFHMSEPSASAPVG